MTTTDRHILARLLAGAAALMLVLGLSSRLGAQPSPSAADDAQLQEQLREVYDQIGALASIEVSVNSGVVELTGELDDPTARETATEIAQKFDGVLFVENKIEFSTDVSERVSPALERAWEKTKDFAGSLPLFGLAVLILIIFWYAARLVGRIKLPGKRLANRPFIENIIRQLVSLVVFLIGVLFVLDLFGVTTLVGAVLGTAGVAGLALGFAFRDIAENYLASIILGIQQPFSKNDLVEVDGYEGKVIRMTTRETVLMTLSGNHVRIPNATVFKNVTTNFTRNPRRRFEFTVGIGVDEEISEAFRVGVETIRETEGVAREPEPLADVEELGDSTVVLSFYGWVDQADYDWPRVKSESIRRVKNALDAAGIEMPEPIYRVYTAEHRTGEEADRKRQRAEEELREPGQEVEATPEIDEQIEQDRARSDETDLLQD
jgi:small-conductance mechanosensitive channel